MTGPATPFVRLLHATVIVRDVAAAVAWYRDVMGLHVRQQHRMRIGERTYQWVDVAFADQEAGLTLSEPLPQADGSPPPAPGSSSMVTIEVADCEAAVAAVADNGGKVVTAPEAFERMLAAIVRDPDGNPISLLEMG